MGRRLQVVRLRRRLRRCHFWRSPGHVPALVVRDWRLRRPHVRLGRRELGPVAPHLALRRGDRGRSRLRHRPHVARRRPPHHGEVLARRGHVREPRPGGARMVWRVRGQARRVRALRLEELAFDALVRGHQQHPRGPRPPQVSAVRLVFASFQGLVRGRRLDPIEHLHVAGQSFAEVPSLRRLRRHELIGRGDGDLNVVRPRGRPSHVLALGEQGPERHMLQRIACVEHRPVPTRRGGVRQRGDRCVHRFRTRLKANMVDRAEFRPLEAQRRVHQHRERPLAHRELPGIVDVLGDDLGNGAA
mmetsp:Transcript_61574/g.177213  ORF Transcript_61574/g.177213 Transcript_61574/m.177213 type:complete len:302 (+) Transcript_61574:857-1762(+)